MLFFCVDGLPGFKEAINAVFPQAQIQRCVIHMLRNSFKYVNYRDLKKFSADFKAVYNAPNKKAGLDALAEIREKWGRKYPYAVSSWENNWEDVSSFFQFPDEIRRIMYTTYADKKTIPTFLDLSGQILKRRTQKRTGKIRKYPKLYIDCKNYSDVFLESSSICQESGKCRHKLCYTDFVIAQRT